MDERDTGASETCGGKVAFGASESKGFKITSVAGSRVKTVFGQGVKTGPAVTDGLFQDGGRIMACEPQIVEALQDIFSAGRGERFLVFFAEGDEVVPLRDGHPFGQNRRG